MLKGLFHKILTAALFILFTSLLFAQKGRIDSLKKIVDSDPPYGEKIKTALLLIKEYAGSEKFEEALKLADGMENEALKQGDNKALKDLHGQKGIIHYSAGRYQEALSSYKNNLKYAVQLNDKAAQADYYNNVAIIFLSQGDYNRGIENLLESLKYDEKKRDPDNLSVIYSNLGGAYNKIKNYEKALEYNHKALKTAEDHNLTGRIGVSLNNIGSVYLNQKKYEPAIEYFHKSIEASRKAGNLRVVGYSLSNIGEAYYELKKYSEAMEYFKRSFKILSESKDLWGEINLKNQIGKIYIIQKRYGDAERILLEIQKKAAEMKIKPELVVNYELLAQLDSARGNFSRAYMWKNKFISLKDELFNESKSKEIGRLEAKYEYEIKEEKIILEKEKERIASEARLKEQNQYIYTFVGVIPLLMIIIYLLYRSRKQKHIINEKLQSMVEKRTAELNLAKDKAESSEKLKESFLSLMSHEIRTPLNSVINLSGLLNQEIHNLEDEEVKDIIGSISRSGNRIIRTIELILNYSEMTSGTYQPLFKEVYIEYLCRRLFDELKYEAIHKGLEIKIECSENGSAVFADEFSCSVIMKNIIENAIIYTEEGEILIEVKDEEGGLAFICRDSGIGISEEYKEMLFQPFTQEELGYTRKYEGLGLGLALVKKYCDMNGALISCESAKGKGSVFKVLFKKEKSHT